MFCLQAKKGHKISLQMVVSYHGGCWELNSGPLKERSVLLTLSSLSSLARVCFCIRRDFII